MFCYIIGFTCSGKSTYGRWLAEQEKTEFLDLDEELEARGGQSIAEIISAGGMEYFRALETDILLRSADLIVTPPQIYNPRFTAVIATGGGCVLSPLNRQHLKQIPSRVIFIDTPWETIYRRLCLSPRPLFQDKTQEEIRQEYQWRLPLYRECADEVVNPC